MRGEVSEASGLEIEARVFGECLVGRRPPQVLIDRYCQANRILLHEPAAPRDAALVAFIRRYPWSASLLDAACALIRPGCLLRNKFHIMAAILETSPEFADEFLPRTTPPFRLVISLAGHGLMGLVHTLAGMLIYPLAVRS